MMNFIGINNSLLDQSHILIPNWLPMGKREGKEYVALNPTRNDNNLGSFRINLFSGHWADFATGDKGGDIISLYAYLNGVSQYQAAQSLASNNIASTILPKAPKMPKVTYAKDSRYIQKIWNEGAASKGSLVERYLQARGFEGVIPDTLKYHARLYHKESQLCYPAMVSAITIWPDNEVVAVHRTYLKGDGSAKANIEPAKKILGSIKGGAVQITPPRRKLLLTEGIETALSVYHATGDAVWATLSSSNMPNITLPPPDITPEILIAADADPVGKLAANKLVNRLLLEGYRVSVAMPPEGLDFNDLLRESA